MNRKTIGGRYGRAALCSGMALLFPVTLSGLAAGANAQTKGGQQVVKPPIATAHLDLSTVTNDFGGGSSGGGAPGRLGDALRGGLGGLLRGNAAAGEASRGNAFGSAQGMGSGPGKYVDVSVYTSRNRQLSEAVQNVPAGMSLGTSLKLLVPDEKTVADEPRDKVPREHEEKQPKGKMLLYWGCGESIRPGQPRVLDFATAKPDDIARFFVSRSVSSQGARAQPGHPAWPNKEDDRRVPDNASLVGQHNFEGIGIPPSFKLTLTEAHDLLAPIELAQIKKDGGSVALEWKSIPHARGYFITVMGGKFDRASGAGESIVWTSSELADSGSELLEFQPNAHVDKLVGEKVVLPATATSCTVPAGIFGEGAGGGGGMLQMIAYGSEAFFTHPPRPTDPKVPWEPEWQAKLRIKSAFTSVLGGISKGEPRSRRESGDKKNDKKDEKKEEKKDNPLDKLRGLFGR